MNELRDPTHEEVESPLFNAIWNTIKTWDIAVPGAYYGYCGANGSHVATIMDAIRFDFNIKEKSFYDQIAEIDKIIEEVETDNNRLS